MGKKGGRITTRALFLPGLIAVEKARKVGMMCGWPNCLRAADWRMHIPLLVSVRWNACKGCSAIRRLASSRSFGGEKNDLRRMRYGASHLVRPQAPAGPGFALRRPPHLPRFGGAAGGLPAVRRGEARAAGVFGRQRPAHEAFCAVRRSALPQRYDQGRGRGTEPGLANGQTAGN